MLTTSLFTYSTCLEFLTQRLAELKAQDKKYSLSYFSKHIGTSETYIKQILAGRRQLTLEKAKRLASRIGLEAHEVPFFLTLVMKDKAKSKEITSYFNSVLQGLREREHIVYSNDAKSKCVFHNALTWEIYTLAATKDFSTDSEKISSQLRQTTSPEVVVAAFEFLKAQGAVLVGEDGKISTKNVVFHDEQDVSEAYRTAFRRAASHDFRNKPNDKFEAFCMALGPDEMVLCKQALQEAKEKIFHIVRNGKTKDRIAWFNACLFEASQA